MKVRCGTFTMSPFAALRASNKNFRNVLTKWLMPNVKWKAVFSLKVILRPDILLLITLKKLSLFCLICLFCFGYNIQVNTLNQILQVLSSCETFFSLKQKWIFGSREETLDLGSASGSRGLFWLRKRHMRENISALYPHKIISWPTRPSSPCLWAPANHLNPLSPKWAAYFFKVSLICAHSAPWLEMGGTRWSSGAILEHARLSCLLWKSCNGSDFPRWKFVWWEKRGLQNPLCFKGALWFLCLCFCHFWKWRCSLIKSQRTTKG